MPFRRATLALGLLLLFPVIAFRAQSQQPTVPDAANATDAVVETVQAIFAAATADDLDKFHSVTTAGFYLYDNGARFDGDAIMTLMKQAHSKGQKYEWNVTNPDVHITGDTAWIAYVNQGSITDTSGKQDLQWLESAFLIEQDGKWKITFMHSTRVSKTSLQAATVGLFTREREMALHNK